MDFKSIIILAGILLFCTAEAIVNIDIHKVKDHIDQGYHYLDVRTPEEFYDGHVDFEDISNIPYMFKIPEGRVHNPHFLKQVSAAFNEDDKIVVGCQLGIRSVNATRDLEYAGFKHVVNMEGGFKVWTENGLGVKKPLHEEM